MQTYFNILCNVFISQVKKKPPWTSPNMTIHLLSGSRVNLLENTIAVMVTLTFASRAFQCTPRTSQMDTQMAKSRTNRDSYCPNALLTRKIAARCTAESAANQYVHSVLPVRIKHTTSPKSRLFSKI